jgi:hypothetical protein
MQAAGIETLGGEVQMLELAAPGFPAPDEVVISVGAAGVGNWDEIVRVGGWDVGRRPPLPLGAEAAGVVAGLFGVAGFGISGRVSERMRSRSDPPRRPHPCRRCRQGLSLRRGGRQGPGQRRDRRRLPHEVPALPRPITSIPPSPEARAATVKLVPQKRRPTPR